MRTQTVESDITVIGGGLAGVCAAISAARLGKKVALIGNRPVLGGNSSSEVRVWVVGATAHGIQRYARETGIIGELYVENQYRNPEGNPIIWDEVVHDAVRAEANVTVFLNTDVREVDTDTTGGENLITRVRGWTMGSETLTTFVSPYFLDCTGDGFVGFLAGADHRIGREAAAEFDESWAPAVADGELLGSTILFYTKDLGRPVDFVAPDSAKDIRKTPIPASRILRSGDSGAHYWWVEWGGHLDTVHDNEVIRDELRSVIFGIWDFIKNSGEFDADNLDLEWVGALPGKREYRRFLGDYVLTQNDILDQIDHPDDVAFGGWSIDLHPVEGMYAAQAGAHQRYSNGIFGIPFRSYFSRNVDNLLFAGRDISATHVAFGSTRVMATCGAGGEAAGTGAALALELGVRPRALARDHADELRQTLLRQDASVFGVRNTDPEDRARVATVTATSWARSIDPLEQSPAAGESAVPLDTDLGLLLPVDPALAHLEVLLDVTADTILGAQLWSTGRKQNAVPLSRHREVQVQLAAAKKPQWVRIPLSWTPIEPENVVVVLKENADVAVRFGDAQVPGVLALPHRPQADGDSNVAVEESESVIAWPAIPLRGRSPRVRVYPETAAYSPTKAVGGFQRFYGGPNMWVSSTMDGEEALELSWDEPQDISCVRIVFDDDPDVELNTLHHHRTPDRIFPELVRDYTLDVRSSLGWQEVVAVTANRRRQRVHQFAPRQADGLRLRVAATAGVPQARVVSLRVY